MDSIGGQGKAVWLCCKLTQTTCPQRAASISSSWEVWVYNMSDSRRSLLLLSDPSTAWAVVVWPGVLLQGPFCSCLPLCYLLMIQHRGLYSSQGAVPRAHPEHKSCARALQSSKWNMGISPPVSSKETWAAFLAGDQIWLWWAAQMSRRTVL